MVTRDEVFAKMAKQTTVVGSLGVYTKDLRQKLADAEAVKGGPLSQADIDQVFAGVDANTQTAADAMVENTPNQP